MRISVLPMILSTLALAIVVGLVAIAPVAPLPASYAQAGPTTPPVVYNAAIDALNVAIPGIGRPDSWRHEVIDNYSDASLGCPTAPTTALGRTVGVYRVWLRYGDIEYLYHVSNDGTVVVPCDPKITAGVTGGDDDTTQPPVNSSCRIDATLANVRSFPDSTADNVVGEIQNGSAPAIGRTEDSSWFQVTLSNGIVGWIAASASTAVGDCANLPVTGSAVVEFSACPVGFAPDYLTPRISVGDTARIIDGGDPNVVRQQPERSAERVGLLQPGTQISVLSGPLCGGGYVWWQVTGDGITGWTVESFQPDNDYYIEPVAAGGVGSPGTGASSNSSSGIGSTGTTGVAASNEIINLQNVARLTSIRSLSVVNAVQVAYSPDGRYLAVIDGAGVQLYSYPDYTLDTQLSAALTPTDGNIITTALAFSNDGRYLVMGYSVGSLWAVDFNTGNIFRLAPELQASINAIEFDANNRMVVASGSVIPGSGAPRVAVYDFNSLDSTGGLTSLLTIFSDEGAVLDATFADDNNVAYLTINALRVVDLTSGAVFINTQIVRRGGAQSDGAVLLPAQNFAGINGFLSLNTISNQTTLMGWNSGDFNVQPLFPITASVSVNDLVVLPNATNGTPLLVVATDSTAQGTFFIQTADQQTRVWTTQASVFDIAVSPDGRHIAATVAQSNGAVNVQIFAIQ